MHIKWRQLSKQLPFGSQASDIHGLDSLVYQKSFTGLPVCVACFVPELL